MLVSHTKEADLRYAGVTDKEIHTRWCHRQKTRSSNAVVTDKKRDLYMFVRQTKGDSLTHAGVTDTSREKSSKILNPSLNTEHYFNKVLQRKIDTPELAIVVR